MLNGDTMDTLIYIIICLFVWGPDSLALNRTYGETPTLTKPTTLDRAIEKFPNIADQTILVKGKVIKICQKKGCWMTLQSGGKVLRITFKDYSFFVPPNIQNRSALVQGKLIKKSTSQAQRRHFLEDAGASAGEIAKVIGSRVEWSFVATGVTLE